MKLEREQLFGHITLSRKTDSKSLDYNDNNLDSTGLKSGNRVIKENQKRLLFDLKDNERDAVQLSYLMKAGDGLDASKLDCSKSVDDSIAHKEYQVTDFVGKLEKDSQFYMDKSVMECELPEFVVCYKESNNHAVKDICIDEGVPSQDKILIESGVNEKDGCTFVFPDNDQNKQEQVEIHIPTKFKSSLNSEKYGVNFCETKDLMQKGEVKYNATNKSSNDVSKEKIFPGNVLLMQELGREKSHSRSTSKESIAPEHQTFQISSEITNTVSTSFVSASEESNNRSGRPLPSSTTVSVAELNNIGLGNELFYNSNVENGSITFDFDSLASSVAIAKDERPQDGSFDCPETQNMTPVDDDKIDTRGVSSQDQEGLAPLSVTREECPQNGGCGCLGTKHVPKVDDGISNTKIPSSEVQNELAREDCPQNGACASFETTNTSVVDGTSEAEVVSGEIQHGIGREECPQNVVCGCCETRTMPILEDDIPGSLTVSRTKPILDDGIPGSLTVSSRFQYSQGESSFSAAGPLSSLINFSGPIAYSGNISLRSDSSTTSTRSFAFPVLQSEWNSSPVRMAKADRRHFRKHRGWRQGLLCCRF